MATTKRTVRYRKLTRIATLLAVLVVLVALVVGFKLVDRRTTTKTPTTTSKVGVEPKTNGSGYSQSGGVVATSPSPSASPPGSGGGGGASSTSGLISLTSPVAGATIGNGTVISGSAQVSAIQYLIKDNVVGVLTQGELPVTNGTFSGTVQGLQPQGTSGELELYSTNSSTGVVENEIQIAVNYQ